MRLIDADALIDEIKYIAGQDTIMWFDDRKIKREQEVNMAAFIERMPTIDPVKHGEWKLNYALPTLKPFCSVCGKDSPTKMRYDYCPNCGAEMT